MMTVIPLGYDWDWDGKVVFSGRLVLASWTQHSPPQHLPRSSRCLIVVVYHSSKYECLDYHVLVELPQEEVE